MPPTPPATLHGVWAAQPIAWNDRDEFDPDSYESDIAYLCSAGIHGIYSGGTTGEFYALDFDEFVKTNTVMLRVAHSLAVPVQVGVTGLSTRQVIKRARWAAEHGTEGVQVALPFWLPLNDDEVVTFFEDVGRAAGASYIVLYDTMRAKRTISPQLLARIRESAPNLTGVKYGGELQQIGRLLEAAPGYAVFTDETDLCEAGKLGATGTYSSIVLTNPALMLALYDACSRSDDALAAKLTARIQRWMTEAVYPLYAGVTDNAYWDSAIDRLQAMLNPNMRCGLRCRGPYKSCTQRDVDQVRSWIEHNDPQLLCS